jgi:hypothetical protein
MLCGLGWYLNSNNGNSSRKKCSLPIKSHMTISEDEFYMVFYVIGNGFDLHYGLKTDYFNFKRYLIANRYEEVVRKADELFEERGEFNPALINNWSDFENMLIVFNNLLADDLYEEAMNDAEDDDDRAGYWDSPSWNVRYYNDYIKILKEQFDLWIKSMDTHITVDDYFRPQKEDYILTFNYTTTIEDNYNCYLNIAHIHGTKDQEIILGHNNYQEPDGFNIIEDEDSDYREITTKKAVNDVLRLASTQYYKNSLNILQRSMSSFLRIPNYEKVIVMGLSCGKQDEMYIQEIIKYSKVIDFYFHNDEAKNNFNKYVDVKNTNINFIKW